MSPYAATVPAYSATPSPDRTATRPRARERQAPAWPWTWTYRSSTEPPRRGISAPHAPRRRPRRRRLRRAPRPLQLEQSDIVNRATGSSPYFAGTVATTSTGTVTRSPRRRGPAPPPRRSAARRGSRTGRRRRRASGTRPSCRRRRAAPGPVAGEDEPRRGQAAREVGPGAERAEVHRAEVVPRAPAERDLRGAALVVELASPAGRRTGSSGSGADEPDERGLLEAASDSSAGPSPRAVSGRAAS